LLYEEFDKRFKHADGSRFIVLSDEWYLRIGKEVPAIDYYDTLDLEENGVGQVRNFKEKWTDFDIPAFEKETHITIGSGKLISDTFRNWFIPN
jgi:hypothetical protein